MIYLDTSVALAHLFGEKRAPRETLWDEELVSSRLLEYELWTRLNARQLGRSHRNIAHRLLSQLFLLELTPSTLARALQPFPIPLRTLDTLHLASAAFLQSRGQAIAFATYDTRLAAAAQAIGMPLAAL